MQRLGRILVKGLLPPAVPDKLRTALQDVVIGTGADDPALTPGWGEPAQTPTFGELTIMVRGKMRVEMEGEAVELKAEAPDNKDNAAKPAAADKPAKHKRHHGKKHHAKKDAAASTAPAAACVSSTPASQ